MRKKVLVFGTFDDIHPGHEFFLRSAKSRGTDLIVGVARDIHVVALKGHKPRSSENKRLENIQKLPYVDQTFLCDEILNTFEIIQISEPDTIILGHDQVELEKSLITWMSEKDLYIPIVRIKKI
ncbi:MAG: FAD synthase [Candidatus Uhrbacteria bacterium GW2011_GWF2_39_13]|uniref:FAD synthase n=1 Tax=Candidatus Uhrbacteria bacterium GW2011_GWF2_39_13 TaxID=1618995 RepID=A0A0G0Q2H9_9BACT|nr:MAG: FAD synthase [Candidatus Uhrbacteria bacterium GW2011_GWF2_39_13]HAU66592.1 FAD synthase [Candidatus Uhrbacteria bacterium]